MSDIVGAGALNYITLFIFICLPRLKEIGQEAPKCSNVCVKFLLSSNLPKKILFDI